MKDGNLQAPTEVYAVFAGTIDQQAVQRIFNGVTLAMASGIRSIHQLLHSNGGFVADGICLYNFFRTLPIDLTIYNVGSLQSIAAIAYLGAQHRKVSLYSTFMVHRSHVSPQAVTADRLQNLAESLAIDDERTEAILREHLVLTDDKWTAHKSADLWFGAEDAVQVGLAHEIGEFAPPFGTQVYYV